jgi:hypothetical protein
MTDRTCPNPNCCEVFKYPSGLKRHFETSHHCKKEQNDIDLYFFNIKQDNKNKNKCNICNILFKKHFLLLRHLGYNKCSSNNNSSIGAKNNKSQQIEELREQIQELREQIQNTHIKKPKTNKKIQIVNITNNNNLTVNSSNNSNNNTLNANTINHIYPLGFEKLPLISQEEMLRLLELGDKGVVEIVKLVCDQDENKNFYKLNMNKTNISYLSNQYKIDVCQEAELKQTLLKQCVILTYQMLIICSPLLSSDKIFFINSNLQNISTKMKEEIYEHGLKNIIEYELRNNSKNTKDKIKKYTKEINDNVEIKEQALVKYNTILQIKENTNKSLSPEITLYEINHKLGNPLKLKEMTFDFTYNEFNTKRFEETTYFRYWNKRIIDEDTYIKSHELVSIGDIANLENRKTDIIQKLEFMKEQSIKMREYDNYNNSLVNEYNFRVEIANDYIRENNRKTRNICSNITPLVLEQVLDLDLVV